MKPPKSFIEFSRKQHLFVRLRQKIQQSNLGIVPHIYIARMLFFSLIAFIVTLIYSIPLFMVLGFGFASIVTGIFLSILSGGLIFILFYTYPSYLLTVKRRSIEANLPFAANHMGALAASGIPPHLIFKMLTDAKEYGEVASEAKRIVRNIEVFGMGTVRAINQVADRTPSPEFKQLLSGISSTITTGGDLQTHLKNSAREALSEYRAKRERYTETLGTYADFYVGVLIAAPLFFVAVLSLLAVIGGQIGGLSIPSIITLGIFGVIPLLNIIFILFVHFTQPPQ